jgi:hypothetical protein
MRHAHAWRHTPIDYNGDEYTSRMPGNGLSTPENLEMKRIKPVCTGGLLALALLSGTVAAEQIYRSVDAEGNVTFSNQPPDNAVSVDKVDVEPGPSEAAQREAQERMQRQEEAAQELGEARASRAKQQEKQAAPPAPEAVEPAEPLNQEYVDPYVYPPVRDRIRDRLPRPVPRPVPRPPMPR